MFKNNKKFNQILSLFLVFCMLFSCFPNIFAQGEEQDEYYTNYYDSTYIEKVWDDAGHESERPSSIDLIFWGTNDYEDSENFQNGVEAGRITLTSANETSDTTWTYTDPLSLVYFEYYYLTEEMPESSPYEMVDSFVNTEINEQSISAYSLGNILGAEITNKYVDNSKLVKFNIEKIWDDTGYEDIRPTSITVEIYGTNTENSITDGEKIGELTITGNSSTNKWTATTETIETSYDYFYIVENTMNNYSATIIQPTLMEPVPVSTTNVEPSNNNVSPLLEENNNALIKAEEIENADTSETFSFMISKMWVEPINLLNERAESITFNLYQNNEKIDSLTMTAEDADDDMTWINGFANKYPKYDENGNPYEYRIEEEKSETTTGVPYLATFDENINSIATLGDENNTTQILTVSNQRFPVVTIFEVVKEWKDEGFESERPSNITIAIYLDSDKNGTPDTYLSEVDLNSSNVDPDNSNKWVSFALIPIDEFDLDAFEPEHIYLVEDTTTSEINLLTEIDNKYVANVAEIRRLDPDYLPDELHPSVGSLMPDWLIEYNDVSYQVVRGFTSTVVNEHIDQYAAKITNRFVPEKEHIQFKINKIWEDNNNEHNLRPSSIQVEIYGTNTAGATEGGELLDTVTLTNTDISDTSGENTWTKLSNSIETNYNYFYAKEINGPDTYTSVISPIVKAEDYSLVRGEDLEEPNPYIVKPFAAWSGYDYDVNVRVHKLDENGNYLPGATLIMNDIDEDYGWQLDEWTTTNTYHESWFYACAGGGIGYEYQEIMPWYIMEREAPEGYQTINPIEIAWEDIFPEDVTNAREAQAAERAGKIPPSGTMVFDLYIVNKPLNAPELYEVNITNTVIPPERDVQFKINKVWDDQDNRFNERGPISIEVFGTNTEGATTNGISLGSFTITESDSTGTNTWSKTSPVYSTNFKYFYIVETFNNASYTSTISSLEKIEPEIEEFNPYVMERPSTYVGGGAKVFSIDFYKTWEDNDNAADKRPEFIDLIVLYSDIWTENEEDLELYAKFRVFEDNAVVLEDPLNRFDFEETTVEDWTFSANSNTYDDRNKNYLVKEINVPNYVSQSYQFPSSDYNAYYHYVEMLNTYYVETYEATITNTYIAPIANVFNISKVWADQGNLAGLRPEGIKVEIYGTNTPDATTGGELLKTTILNSSNANSENDSIWEKQVVVSTTYNYFYVVETSLTGEPINSYTLTKNTVTKTGPEASAINANKIMPYTVKHDNLLTIYKIWEDNDNILGLRPQSVILTIYQNSVDDEATKQLLAKVKLYNDRLEFLEIDNNYITDNTTLESKDWMTYFHLNDTVPSYLWVEEEPSTLYNMTYYKDYGPVDDTELFITNTIKSVNTYNVELVNTVNMKHINFNITKTWDDFNNLANVRPDSIKVQIYGTNTEGATTGGELLETVELTNQDETTEDTNVWNKSVTISSNYNYFYIKEVAADGSEIDSYALTQNTLTKVDLKSQFLANRPSTYGGIGFDDFLYINKQWNDNDNALGLRPDSIVVKIYGNNEIYESTKKYLGTIKIYENDCEALDLFTEGNPSSYGDWFSTIYIGSTKMPEYLWIEEIDASNNYNMEYDYYTKGSVEILNTINNVDFYNVELTNTIDLNFVNFNITKTWEDQNNIFGLRPSSIDVEIYGTNTQGATTGGELIQTVTLRSTDVSESDSNKWELTTPMIATEYDYFYIKEANVPSAYAVSISALTKINTQDQSNEAEEQNIEPYRLMVKYFAILLYKEWDDNNNANGLRPEYVDFNIYYNTKNVEATKQLYGKIRLYEDRYEVLDDPLSSLGEGMENYGLWETGINSTFEHYSYYYWIEELPVENYTSDLEYDRQASAMVDQAYELYIHATNTYTGPEVDRYSVEITNTLEVQTYNIEINKVWDDDGFENVRPEEIVVKIYGTNNQTDATNKMNGTLIGQTTLTSDENWMSYDSFQSMDNFTYIYAVEELPENSIDYIVDTDYVQTTFVPQGRIVTGGGEGPDSDTGYSAELTITNIAPDKKINIIKEWDDNDQLALRPATISVSILQNGELFRVVTLSAADNWKLTDIEVPRFDENGNEYVYSLQESIPEGYSPSYSEKQAYNGPVRIKFTNFKFFEEGINNFVIIYEKDGNYYSMNVSDGSSYTGFALDSNNCIEIPSPNFYIHYSWGFVSGSRADFAIESIEKIESTTNQGAYVDNINGLGLENAPEVTDITDIKLDFSGLDVESDKIMWKYVAFAENALIVTNSRETETRLTITKIWIDDNNMYFTRPDSLNITVYQNGVVYRVLTFTNMNADINNSNVWKSTISVPMYDANGNECVYTISEDESNLFLDYYYYEPYINQDTLTATNVGIWLPPLTLDMNDPATYTIVLGKEILNENDEIATEEDFWKLKLNIDDTYEFPIVLKEMNRTISRGETGMLETYEGYTGNTFKGVLTNKGRLIFTNLQPGKYEISEIVNQYFDFIGMETIYASDGASLTCEDGKYYIELSGVTEVFEEISVKVINKLEDERPFNDLDSKDNLYYVSSREQIEEIAQEMLERNGMTGRLYIPDVNYDVALFEVSASDGAANQRVTDKSDSAAFMKWGQQWLVADHYYQGFDKMKNAKPGTIAYINNGERIQAYICTEKAAGENVSYTLLDNKGNDLYDRNAGGICMYTCNVVIYNGQDITYSLWQPIN